MKLSVKFSLIISALLITSMSVIISLFVAYDQKYRTQEVERKGQTLMTVLTTATTNLLLNHDYSAMNRYCSDLMEDPDVLSIAILSPEGRVLMHSDLDQLGELWAMEEIPPLPGHHRIIRDITIRGMALGTIQLNLTDYNAMTELKESTRQHLMIGVLMIIAGILIAVFMAETVTGPLNKLAVAADEVSRGNLVWETPPLTGDEVESLSHSFGIMVERLRYHIDSLIKNERMALAGQLSSVLAHEIRNPLEPIKGAATMLKVKYPGEEPVARYCSMIEQEVMDLTTFLDSFLEFARPRDPEFSLMYAAAAVRPALELLTPYAAERNVTIQPEVPETGLLFRSDPQQFRQILINILINAIDAAAEGGREIRLTAGMDETAVRISVTDNGPGISEENLPRIFEPYFTTKAKGTGLGLANCQTLTQINGGDIAADSVFGKGTTLTLRFPRTEEGQPE